MAQLCDYSSLIFAGNTTVLLILSLATDYWEYRYFDVQKIQRAFKKHKNTDIFLPIDTDSYLQIKFSQNESKLVSKFSSINTEEVLYHAPLFVKRQVVQVGYTDFGGINDIRDTDNVVIDGQAMINAVEESELNLFKQYGNLFRDCDDLEAVVRDKMGLNRRRPQKCVYFDSARDTSSVYEHAPELAHLESCASACALLCIVATCIGSFAGAYGLSSKYNCYRAYTLAACLSLVAGFFLTLAIALFHGKCHILRKMDLLPGYNLPLKDILNDARQYTYGWSFILAWICVFFCYSSSYVWLYKSQGSRKGDNTVISQLVQKHVARKRPCSNQWVLENSYDIVTV